MACGNFVGSVADLQIFDTISVFACIPVLVSPVALSMETVHTEQELTSSRDDHDPVQKPLLLLSRAPTASAQVAKYLKMTSED